MNHGGIFLQEDRYGKLYDQSATDPEDYNMHQSKNKEQFNGGKGNNGYLPERTNRNPLLKPVYDKK